MKRVQIETALGTIVAEIFDEQAPASAGYFLDDVWAARYDGSSFFRIVTLANQTGRPKIEVIQGGLKHERTDLPVAILHESTAMSGIKHLKGTLSHARFAPGAVYHSFFICLRDERELDFGGARHPDGQGFAAFGRVAEGFDVVERIFARGEAEEYVQDAVRIERVRAL